ncbi:MAG: PQQ-binding-like beta-propeller repeat protein [Planctomycetaceae bacterium]|nr:PQQ-binding-like beta-propeller repeat protein [Planctomycetaceae bacterium]
MPVLKIRNSAGSVETRVLSKDQPLAIGRHSSNDIQVDEDGVATLHCRISWGGKEFQIASANSTGVVVNNQLTFRADLQEGDTIRVGSLEFTYRENQHASDDDDHIPLAGSDPEYSFKAPPPAESPKGTRETESDSKKNLALTGEIITESLPPPIPKKKKGPKAPDSLESLLAGMDVSPNEMEGAALPDNTPKSTPLFVRKPVRPGEQEVTRSPIVMFLGGGMLVLILIALTLFFLVDRETAQQAYDRGLDELKQKRFSVSIERFQEFTEAFPQHNLVKSAVSYSNLAKVEQVLASSTPDWARALSLLEVYTRSIRDLSNFSEMQVFARDVATRIAFGAAESAGLLKKRELIETSENSARVLEMNSPADQRPAELLKQISDAQVKAKRIILRFDFTADSLAKISGHLEQQDTLASLQEYQRLLDEYPDCKTEPDVAAKFQQILTVDKSRVKTEDADLAAATEDAPPNGSDLVLVKTTRARADLVESGANVFALVGSACYAVDSGTGAIRWRRSVGPNLPFAPIPVTSNVLCVLLYDSRLNELILLQQRDGKLVWKLPVPAPIHGTPVVHEGRILFLTVPSTLMQVDLATGTCNKQVVFPQPVVGSPVLVGNANQVVVAGNQQFTYILDARSLDCLSSIQTGQRDNAIQSSPITLGNFVLFPEIDQTDSTQLAVWDFSNGNPTVPLGLGRVPGHVRDQSVLRGKQLFVPSSGERVTTFIVSDQTGTPLLTRTAGYQVPNGGSSPAFLKPGPEDELWMGSSIVQRLELSVDSVVPSGGSLAIGATTQPLQIIDQDLVVVGHPKGVRSFVIIAADRRQMAGRWQLLFGGQAAQTTIPANDSGTVSILSDSGDLYELNDSLFQQKNGGLIRPVSSLPDRPEGYGELFATALPKKGIFVAAGLPEPHWWLLNSGGQVLTDGKLPEGLQSRPIPFADGVVLPFKGKLAFLDPANLKRRIENFIMTQGDAPVDQWIDLQPEDATHFVASTRSGRLSRFQLQSEPSPHLFEVSHVNREVTSDFSFARSEDNLYTAAGNSLECWTSSSWERNWNVDLSETVSGPPRAIGNLVLVETGSRLFAYKAADGSPAWDTEIDSSLAGDVVIWKNQLTIPLASGTVLTLPAAGNADAIQRSDVGRNLSGTVIAQGDSLLLSSDDGSWLRIDSLPGGSR